MKRYIFLIFIILAMNIFSSDYVFNNSENYYNLIKTDYGYSIRINKIQINNINEFAYISLNDFNYTNEIGNPKLPAIKFFVQGNDIDINTIIMMNNKNIVKLKNNRVYPFQKSVSKQDNKRVFSINNTLYESNEIYPNINYKISFAGYSGNKKQYLIEIFPIKYDFENNELIVYNNIEVNIKNNYFEKINNYELPSKYLFVVSSNDTSYIDNLIQLKRQQGFTTEVLLLDTLGSANSDIQTGIRNVYNNSVIPLQFVLLIGDVDKIPNFIGTETNNPPTDLYYSLKDDNDYFPDYYVGRLSFADTTELKDIINKIVLIENGLWSNADDWVNRAYLMASDDPSFHLLAEGTQNYSAKKLREIPMTVDSFYYYYPSGTAVNDALNNGRSMAIYTGHGSETSWAGPSFSQSEIQGLTNADMFPIVLSFACLTGNYAYSSDCFGEIWLKGANGSAMYMGSSVYSYWDEDDIMGRAIVDAIVDSQYTSFAKVMDYSKHAVYAAYSGGGASKRYFEMYNILGDPSIDIFTNIDGILSINSVDTFATSLSQLNIYLTDNNNRAIEEANISVFLNDTFLLSGLTDNSGYINFNISPQAGDSITIYAYKHNYKFISKTIPVINPNYLPYINNFVFNDTIFSINIPDSIFSVSDTGTFDFTVINYGTDTLCSLYYNISTINNYIYTDTLNHFIIDTLLPGDSVKISPQITYVLNNLENNTNEIMNIQLYDNANTLTQTFVRTINAPDIDFVGLSIVDSSIQFLQGGDSINVNLMFCNNSLFKDKNIHININSLSSELTFSKDSFYFDSLYLDTLLTDTFSIIIDTSVSIFTYLKYEIICYDTIGRMDTFYDSIPINRMDYLVLDYDGNNNSGPIIDSLLNDLGYSGNYKTSVNYDELVNYKNVFLCLGAYPSNTSLQANNEIALTLDSLLHEGRINMYMEGGECWFWDPSNGGYDFNSTFSINPISDGNYSLSSNLFEGMNFRISEGLSYNYSGDYQYLDIISAINTGRNFFINSDNYYAVSNIDSSGLYKTVGMSFELGGLDEGTSSKRDLVYRIMEFFEGNISSIDKNLNNNFSFSIMSVYPNPFRKNVLIKYQSPANNNIRFEIFDITGRKIYSENIVIKQAGVYSFLWSGKNFYNEKISSGVYFIRINDKNGNNYKKKLIFIE